MSDLGDVGREWREAEKISRSKSKNAFISTHIPKLKKLGYVVTEGSWVDSWKIEVISNRIYTYCPKNKSLYDHDRKQWRKNTSLKELFQIINFIKIDENTV